MKKLFFLLLVLFQLSLTAQESNSIRIYRAEPTKVFDLIHTQLSVSFDFKKRQMPAEAWIRLKSHFYPNQFLKLDAKSMLIHVVRVNDVLRDYNYDGKELIIDLGKKYTRDETFEVYIQYTARPEEVKQKGSSRITQAKGLYFIDPDGSNPDKPTQVWTQGETESASCWFPTIDAPNQKSTEEIYITIPEKFTTLSNGILVSQKDNIDATRTDHWKMDLPHAPYLFFMGIGEFSVVKDTWNSKTVDYYVEKEYKEVARKIFGNTPEMIEFFSKKFGVDYPWQKYSQMVCRDFVSGAMENTTCTLHSESAYQHKGQLIDENRWEDVISHELSHQWFGDLVTTESWSNISLNESFATYASYLWREHKYGKDHAAAKMYQYRSSYIHGENDDKNLVRFHYTDKEEIFDAVSYQKGAAILHMLRAKLGDEAFFEGLKKYLTDNKFQSAEVQDLRLAFEEVTGKDLNIFFNQWFYGNSHPKLYVSYIFNDLLNTLTLTVKQADRVFAFPLDIALYESGTIANHQIEVSQKEQQFTFRYSQRPDLVVVNASHNLLCELHDESKLIENYVFQYNKANHYEDRREALLKLAEHQEDTRVFNTMSKALNDPYYELRILALNKLNLSNKHKKRSTVKRIEFLAENDLDTRVRAAAIRTLGKFIDPVYKPLFVRGIQAESYAIKRSAIESLYEIDKESTVNAIRIMNPIVKDDLADLITRIYIKEEIKEEMPFVAKHMIATLFESDFTRYHKEAFENTFNWIATSNNKEAIRSLVGDLVKKGLKFKKKNIDQMSLNLLRLLVEKQQSTNNSNKEELILIAKKGMAALLD